jgi:hypothetical protein
VLAAPHSGISKTALKKREAHTSSGASRRLPRSGEVPYVQAAVGLVCLHVHVQFARQDDRLLFGAAHRRGGGRAPA